MKNKAATLLKALPKLTKLQNLISQLDLMIKSPSEKINEKTKTANELIKRIKMEAQTYIDDMVKTSPAEGISSKLDKKPGFFKKALVVGAMVLSFGLYSGHASKAEAVDMGMNQKGEIELGQKMNGFTMDSKGNLHMSLDKKAPEEKTYEEKLNACGSSAECYIKLAKEYYTQDKNLAIKTLETATRRIEKGEMKAEKEQKISIYHILSVVYKDIGNSKESKKAYEKRNQIYFNN